jgi:hypothetical protein
MNGDEPAAAVQDVIDIVPGTLEGYKRHPINHLAAGSTPKHDPLPSNDP